MPLQIGMLFILPHYDQLRIDKQPPFDRVKAKVTFGCTTPTGESGHQTKAHFPTLIV